MSPIRGINDLPLLAAAFHRSFCFDPSLAINIVAAILVARIKPKAREQHKERFRVIWSPAISITSTIDHQPPTAGAGSTFTCIVACNESPCTAPDAQGILSDLASIPPIAPKVKCKGTKLPNVDAKKELKAKRTIAFDRVLRSSLLNHE
ncbi:hypothetical protein PM082_008955 [Marasmius tenuissimus]|nr:hypothetical protein PM082_008955 [Marasmius tenuissimus]